MNTYSSFRGSEQSETTRFRFFTRQKQIDFILDPEWSSVLRPGRDDRIEFGTCDQRPGTLLVFVDTKWQGHQRWQPCGGKGALRIPIRRKKVFEWCQNLIPNEFEYIPAEIEPLRGYPGIRGVALDWPGWIEVVKSNLSTGVSQDLLRTQVDSMRVSPEIFTLAFVDGQRLII